MTPKPKPKVENPTEDHGKGRFETTPAQKPPKEGELPAELREIKEEEKGAKEKGVSGRSGMKLEVFKLEELRGLNFREKPNSPSFEKINVNESVEKQQDEIYELAGTCIFELIPHLLQNGIAFDSITSFGVFNNPPQNLKESLRTGNAQGDLDLDISFNKIAEILRSDKEEDDSVKKVWKEGWNEIASRGKMAFGYMEPSLKKGIPPRKKVEEESSEKKGFFEKHSKAIGYGALAIGLALGAYFIVDKVWPKSSGEQGKEEGFFNKLFKGFTTLGMLAGVGFGLGRISEIKKVREWLKEWKLDDANFIEALRLFSHGELQKAFDKLFESDQKYKTFEVIAQKINVKTESVEKIADVPYQQLFPKDWQGKISKFTGDTVSEGGRKLGEYFLKDVPLIGSALKEDEGFKKDFAAIAQFIELPQNHEKIKQISPGPKMTMKEVLAQLCDVNTATEKQKTEIPSSAAVVAVGPRGREAQKSAAETQGTLEKHEQEIVSSLDKNKKIEKKEAATLDEDAGNFTKVLDEAENANGSWWQREMEILGALFKRAPSQDYQEQDYKKLAEELSKEDTALIQILRTENAKLRKKIAGSKEKPLSAQEIFSLKEDIAKFYTRYREVDAKLDEVKQLSIKEQEERLQKAKGESMTVEDIATGFQLVGNTLFGIPYSVFIKREKNGTIVTLIAYASVATAAIGFAKGIGKGGIGRGVASGLWGATKPVRYLTYEALGLTRKGAEYIDYLRKTAALRTVQNGKATVQEGMQQIEDYLYKYGYKWSGTKIEKQAGAKSLGQRLKSIGRKTELTEDQIRLLEDNMRQLQELKNRGITKWQEAGAKGAVEPARKLSDYMKSEYSATEQKLLAERIEQVKANTGLRKNPSIPLSDEEIRRIAIEELERAGKLSSVEDMATTLKDRLTKSSFNALPDTAGKIEALRETSKEADLYLEKAILRVNQMRRAGVPEAEVNKFMEEVQANLNSLRERFGGSFKTLKDGYKTMQPAEQKIFKELLAKDLANARGIRGIMREMKGRGKFAIAFGVATIAWEYYEIKQQEKADHIRKEIGDIAKTIGLDTLQIVIDVLSPFGISDWYTVISGKECITGNKVGTGARIERAVFGVYNAVTDALAVLATPETAGVGGAAIYGAENVIEASLRAAGKGPAIYKTVKTIIPRIVTLAKEVGGFKNLYKIVKSEKTLEAIQVLRKTKKVAGATRNIALAVDVGKAAFAGYELVFDTKDQPEFIIDADLNDMKGNPGTEPAPRAKAANE